MNSLTRLCMLAVTLVIAGVPADGIAEDMPEAIVEIEPGMLVINARDMLSVIADEGLTVVSSNAYLSTYPDGDRIESCTVYAEIRNDTDHAVSLNGRFLFRQGAQPSKEESNLPFFTPMRIEPGETAYFDNSWYSGVWYKQLSAKALTGISLFVTARPAEGSADGWWNGPMQMICQDDSVSVELVDSSNWSTDPEALRVNFVNRAGEMMHNPAVIVAAYDAKGQLLYITTNLLTIGNSIYDCYVPDASPCALVTSIPRDVSFWMRKNGIEAAEYRTAICYAEIGGAP